MKRNIELVLKGKGKLELETKVLNGFGIEVTYSINDIEDVGSRKSNYSKAFNIIGTPKNNILFQHIYDVNFDSDTFDINAKQPCYLSINNNIVMDGYLKLRSINKTYISGKYQIIYNVNIYDEIKDIFIELSNKNLRDLDFSSGYTFMDNTYNIGNHMFNIDSIKESQSRLLNHKNVYDYPIINWNYNGINNGNNFPTENAFTLSQFYPSIYIKAVVDKMFYDIGYTYESDFFDGKLYDGIFTSLATIYNDSVMLVKNSNYFSQVCLPVGQSFQYDYNDIVRPENDDVNSSIKIISLTNYTTSALERVDGGILIDGDGNYNFSGTITMVSLTVSNADTDMNDSIQIRNQDNDILTEYFLDTLIINEPIEFEFEKLSLKLGDVIYIYYNCGYTLNESTYLGNIARWSQYKMDVSVVNNENIIDKIDTKLSLSNFLPNMTQADFLKSLIKQFNLYIYPDKYVEKHIIIEPRRVFYNKGIIIDWTKKVVDDSILIEPLNKKLTRYYNFKMDFVDSLKTKQYYDKWKSNYGSKEIDLNNENIDGVSNIDSKFTGYDYNYFTTNNNTDYIFIPNFAKELTDSISTQKRDIPPTIGFIKKHSTNGLKLSFVEDNKGNGADIINKNNTIIINTWNTINHVEKFGTTKTPYDLNYETKQGMPSGTINSYQNFWESGMENIFNTNNRVITYYVKLDIIDIKNLDFKNVILIKGELYYIENIVVDINSDNPSKLELIKAYDYLKYTVPTFEPVLWGLVDTEGIIASGAGRPIASEALMDIGYSIKINSDSSILLEPNCTLENYFWFATPNQSVLNKKHSWAVNEYNRGYIGGEVNLGGNLFPDPDIIDFHGVSYNLYIANYQTYIDIIKIDYENSTNIN